MKSERRKDKILEFLKKNGTVKVTNLSKALKVSEVTIRNYLTDMENKGLLTRVHGGAIFSYRPYYSMNLNQRLETNRQAKERIAKENAERAEKAKSHTSVNHANVNVKPYNHEEAMKAQKEMIEKSIEASKNAGKR